ncbi:hypothetical protein [Chitinophaga defluvii]|uniref:Oligosaccharide repeat unit polymerase n=1 Tax=Chitinophaga defluvii TaxID=3163343 RepID=A0ABV2T2K7_9BACT
MFYNTEHFSFYVFLQYFISTLIIFLSGYSRIKKGNVQSKLFYTFYIGGFFFYAGVGAAYKEGVAVDYFMYYLIYLIVFVLFFIRGYKSFSGVEKKFGAVADYKLNTLVANKNFCVTIIIVYLFCSGFSLIYPNFQLYKLVSPPKPDSTSIVFERFTNEHNDLILVLVRYFKLLLTPFFLLALNYFRNRIWMMALVLFLPLYFEFCVQAYIGRSAMLIQGVIFFLILWQNRPKIRTKLVIALAILIPSFIIFSYYYQSLRIGGSQNFKNITLNDALDGVLGIETGFPTRSAEIIDKGLSTDLGAYSKWLITLPFPKFMLERSQGGLVGYEISEHLLGVKRTDTGYFVILYGNVTESIYIYTKYLFWVQPIIIGLLLSYLSRYFGSSKLLLPVFIYLLITCGYNLTRAGTQSAFPVVINNNLLFYIFLYFKVRQVRLAKSP